MEAVCAVQEREAAQALLAPPEAAPNTFEPGEGRAEADGAQEPGTSGAVPSAVTGWQHLAGLWTCRAVAKSSLKWRHQQPVIRCRKRCPRLRAAC